MDERRRKERRNKILIGLVSVTMIFSGIWFFSGNMGGGGVSDDVVLMELLDGYGVFELGDVVVEVKESDMQLVLLPESGCLSSYMIEEVRNLSIAGVEGVSFEVANPQLYANSDTVCGLYSLVCFNVSANFSILPVDASNMLRGVVGEYGVYGSFKAVSADNSSLGGVVRVIVDADASVGDLFLVSLLQRDDGDFVGLLSESVGVGPVVEAQVVELYGLRFTGLVSDGFNRSMIEDSFMDDIESFDVGESSVEVDGVLNESVLGNLSGVRLDVSGNDSVVFFNGSRDGVLGVLSGFNYSVNEGVFVLSLSGMPDVNGSLGLLVDAGCFNVSVERLALVRVPRVVVFDGTVVFLRDGGLIDCRVGVDVGVGVRLNVSLFTVSFGGETVVVGSSVV